MIHRAISGSLERFMGVMIEHFAGAFPVWLSPIQISIIPIADPHMEKAQELLKLLKEKDIRVEILSPEESLGKRIRNAKTNKVPYIAVIGDKDIEAGGVTLEKRGGEKGELIKTEDLISLLEEKIKNRYFEL